MKTQTHIDIWLPRLVITGIFVLMAENAAFGDVPRGYFTDVKRLGIQGEGGAPQISADGLTLYFRSNRSGGEGSYDLYQATRPTVDEAFGDVSNLGAAVNSGSLDVTPAISFDGLTLYFGSNRSGGEGSFDMYQATRSNVNDAFGQVTNLGAINSAFDDRPEYVSPDGLTLYFQSDRPGGYGLLDIYMATRESEHEPFAHVTNLGTGVNGPTHERGANVSANGLMMFFADWHSAPFRAGGQGSGDIWVALRTSTDDPFGNVVNLDGFSLGSDVNTSFNERNPSISYDWPASGSHLYFQSEGEIWQATWIAVDHNISFVPAGSVNALADAIAEAGPGGKVALAPASTTSLLPCSWTCRSPSPAMREPSS